MIHVRAIIHLQDFLSIILPMHIQPLNPFQVQYHQQQKQHAGRWCTMGLRLIHDVTTLDRSVPTPIFLEIDSSRLRGVIRLRLLPYTHSQLIQGAETLHKYMIWICEALQEGFEAQP